MIIGIDFTGRLGNQLFTYAFARNMMTLYAGQDCKLVANFKRSSNGDAEKGFEDGLQYFQVLPYCVEKSDLVLRYGSWSQRIAYLFYQLFTRIPLLADKETLLDAMHRKMERWGIFITTPADQAYPLRRTSFRNIFIKGYFQDKNFFKAIRPLLVSELIPRQPVMEENRHLYEIASRPHTVCVHVRRGDFLSPEYKKDFYLCTPRYFQEAISLMRKHVAEPTFIFFSDDIEWVKENFSLPDVPCYYERSHNPAWESLRLMYSCHHFIISNSTFSWWAQYLGRREDKIVISPSRWYANDQWHSCLADDSFLQISC